MENKWIAGIAATVISGVLVWWLTEGIRRGPAPPAPEPGRQTWANQKSMRRTGLSESWAGSWICRTSDHEMHLTINGQGLSSLLKGYYPVAYGNKTASEDYTIGSITDSNASGEYTYYDASPMLDIKGDLGYGEGTGP